MNNQEEMISSQLDMFCFISLEDLYHGKDFLVDQRLKNMQTLRKRRRRCRLKIYAKINQMNLRNLCTTHVDLASHKTLIMDTLSVFLKIA